MRCKALRILMVVTAISIISIKAEAWNWTGKVQQDTLNSIWRSNYLHLKEMLKWAEKKFNDEKIKVSQLREKLYWQRYDNDIKMQNQRSFIEDTKRNTDLAQMRLRDRINDLKYKNPR